MPYSKLSVNAGVSLGMALVIIAALLFAVSLPASAQDGGNGDKPPTGNPLDDIPEFYKTEPKYTGDAEWEISNRVFKSNYPNGLFFSANITSTGGPVVNARVIWSHAPGNRRAESAVIDNETNTVTVDWSPNVGEGFPAWVAVNYRWTFQDEAGNTYETEWYLGEEYEDNTKSWQRTEGPDVIVFAEEGLPDNIGEQVVLAMEAQRETFFQAWGGNLPYKVRVILYASVNSFAEWQVSGASSERSNRILGTTNDAWGATVQRVSGTDVVDLAWGTVLHEVAHLYQHEFAGAFATGTWWNEGNATLFELNQQYDYEQRVRNLARNNQLPVMLDGTGPGQNSQGPDGINRLGYDAGYTFWKWLVENYGLDAHREVIQAWRRGGLRNDILEDVLGIPATEIEREWRLWLGATGEAPTLVPIPTFRIPPTVTPFIFPTKAPE